MAVKGGGDEGLNSGGNGLSTSPPHPQFHLLARRGSLPLLIVTEGLVAVGGPATVAGGAPFPCVRPLGRPTPPKAGSRGVPDGGLLLLLLANGCMEPLPGGVQYNYVDEQTIITMKEYNLMKCTHQGLILLHNRSMRLADWLIEKPIKVIQPTYLAGQVYLNSDWVESFPSDSDLVCPVSEISEVNRCIPILRPND